MGPGGYLNDPQVLAARIAALQEPHVRAIETWRSGLIDAGHAVPHCDPLDGGVEARLLLLLETPGPGATPLRFVSRDNPTGTARNLRRFLESAGLARRETVLWNAVPWIVHAPGARNRGLRKTEIAAGLAALPGFLALLPSLRAVVLAGRVAGEATPIVQRALPGVAVIAMPHPSPTFVCTSPAVSERIGDALAQAAAILRR